MKSSNYLSIDVEDYFQVPAFESLVCKKDWNSYSNKYRAPDDGTNLLP